MIKRPFLAAALSHAFEAAAAARGGAVYGAQAVRGLSDADADAPLVVAFAPMAGREADLGGEPLVLGKYLANDSGRRFLAQSAFKPLVLAMALEEGMGAQLERRVGEDADVGYADAALSADGRAPNALINSGALLVLESLSRRFSVNEVCAWRYTAAAHATACAPPAPC